MTKWLFRRLGPRRSYRRLAVRATFILFIERLWSALWPAMAGVTAFAGLALLGAWSAAPIAVHAAGLAAAMASIGLSIWRGAQGLRWPTMAEALRRIETDSGFVDRPIAALEDQPAGDASAMGAAFWRAHQERAARQAIDAHVSRPDANIPGQDIFALRLGAILLFLAGMLVAGGDGGRRLQEALMPGLATDAGARLTLDAWIAPPDYTGAAPIYLARAGVLINRDNDEPILVPEAATLVVRVSDSRRRPRLLVRADGIRRSISLDREENGAFASELTLEASGTYILRAGGENVAWRITLKKDSAPQITFVDTPQADENGRLAFNVAMVDDYGVETATARFMLAPDQARPADAPAISEAALAQAGEEILEGVSGARGEDLQDFPAEIDLRAHRWAGLDVDFWIEAVDGKGQASETERLRITIPERDFYYPLAKSVIEQRRNLAVAPDERSRPLRSFDALTLAPEAFFERSSEYLSLRSVYWRLFYNETRSLDALIDQLWTLALSLEDGDLALARRALEDAIEAVRAALERGDPPEQVAQLIERLRDAMERYIRALAAQALQGDALAELQSQGESTGLEDLQDMLSAIDELSELGSRDAARQLLSQFEQMMRNLQVAQGGAGGESDETSEEMRELLSDLMDMIGRQRGLLDETFQRDQAREQEGGDLAEEQGELGETSESVGEALDELQERLGQAGGEEPGGEQGGGEDGPELGRAQSALERAGRAMGRAEQDLREGDMGDAAGEQGQALEELRQGAQSLSDAITERFADQAGRDGGGETDPSGRPVNPGPDYGDGVEVPSEFERARVRELLDELRRRAGERGRTAEELEYIERLLRRF